MSMGAVFCKFRSIPGEVRVSTISQETLPEL